MTFIIRSARREDAAALTALSMASKQSAGYDDTFMAACADELRVTSDQILNTAYWVAEDSVLLGCVRLDARGTIGEIHAFFVHPDHKRKGIGRALWQVVLTASNAAALTSLQLDADPTAVPFYEALGFTTTGRNPSGSIPGRMLPHMEYHL